MFKRLLIPLDGSKAAEVALNYAISLALSYHSEVILARARDPALSYGAWTDYTVLQSVFEAELKVCQDYMAEQSEKFSAARCQVRVEISTELAAEMILTLADQRNVDLILMSSHGRTGMGRFLLGSVAERVSRHARCPVMIVGRSSIEAHRPPEMAAENGVVPTSHSLESQDKAIK